MYKNRFKRIVGMLIFLKVSGIFFIGCNIAKIDVRCLIYDTDALCSILEITFPVIYFSQSPPTTAWAVDFIATNTPTDRV